MISFYGGQITDILPFNLKNSPEVVALSHALQRGTQLIYDYAQRLYLYTDIDSQPEDVLDLVAAEMRTQYYDQGLDINSKRRLVKNTLAWHMTAGTPGAVEELAVAAFGKGEVREWFEYGGNPYCFKVISDIDMAMTPDVTETFITLLKKIKNTRSHLDSVTVQRSVSQESWAGIGVGMSYRPPAIIDGYSETRDAAQNTCYGIPLWQAYRPPAILTGREV